MDGNPPAALSSGTAKTDLSPDFYYGPSQSDMAPHDTKGTAFFSTDLCRRPKQFPPGPPHSPVIVVGSDKHEAVAHYAHQWKRKYPYEYRIYFPHIGWTIHDLFDDRDIHKHTPKFMEDVLTFITGENHHHAYDWAKDYVKHNPERIPIIKSLEYTMDNPGSVVDAIFTNREIEYLPQLFLWAVANMMALWVIPQLEQEQSAASLAGNAPVATTAPTEPKRPAVSVPDNYAMHNIAAGPTAGPAVNKSNYRSHGFTGPPAGNSGPHMVWPGMEQGVAQFPPLHQSHMQSPNMGYQNPVQGFAMGPPGLMPSSPYMNPPPPRNPKVRNRQNSQHASHHGAPWGENLPMPPPSGPQSRQPSGSMPMPNHMSNVRGQVPMQYSPANNGMPPHMNAALVWPAEGMVMSQHQLPQYSAVPMGHGHQFHASGSMVSPGMSVSTLANTGPYAFNPNAPRNDPVHRRSSRADKQPRLFDPYGAEKPNFANVDIASQSGTRRGQGSFSNPPGRGRRTSVGPFIRPSYGSFEEERGDHAVMQQGGRQRGFSQAMHYSHSIESQVANATDPETGCGEDWIGPNNNTVKDLKMFCLPPNMKELDVRCFFQQQAGVQPRDVFFKEDRNSNCIADVWFHDVADARNAIQLHKKANILGKGVALKVPSKYYDPNYQSGSFAYRSMSNSQSAGIPATGGPKPQRKPTYSPQDARSDLQQPQNVAPDDPADTGSPGTRKISRKKSTSPVKKPMDVSESDVSNTGPESQATDSPDTASAVWVSTPVTEPESTANVALEPKAAPTAPESEAIATSADPKAAIAATELDVAYTAPEPTVPTTTPEPDVATIASKPDVASTTPGHVAKMSVFEPVVKTSASEPVAKTSASEPMAKTSASDPLAKTGASEPTVKITTSEPITKTATSEPITKTATSDPITKAATSEPITKTATSEPITKTATSEPIAKTTTPEPKAKATAGDESRPLSSTKKGKKGKQAVKTTISRPEDIDEVVSNKSRPAESQVTPPALLQPQSAGKRSTGSATPVVTKPEGPEKPPQVPLVVEQSSTNSNGSSQAKVVNKPSLEQPAGSAADKQVDKPQNVSAMRDETGSDDDQKNDVSFHSAKESQSDSEKNEVKEDNGTSSSAGKDTVLPTTTKPEDGKVVPSNPPPKVDSEPSAPAKKKPGAKQTVSLHPFAKPKSQAKKEKTAKKKEKQKLKAEKPVPSSSKLNEVAKVEGEGGPSEGTTKSGTPETLATPNEETVHPVNQESALKASAPAEDIAEGSPMESRKQETEGKPTAAPGVGVAQPNEHESDGAAEASSVALAAKPSAGTKEIQEQTKKGKGLSVKVAIPNLKLPPKKSSPLSGVSGSGSFSTNTLVPEQGAVTPSEGSMASTTIAGTRSSTLVPGADPASMVTSPTVPAGSPRPMSPNLTDADFHTPVQTPSSLAPLPQEQPEEPTQEQSKKKNKNKKRKKRAPAAAPGSPTKSQGSEAERLGHESQTRQPSQGKDAFDEQFLLIDGLRKSSSGPVSYHASQRERETPPADGKEASSLYPALGSGQGALADIQGYLVERTKMLDPTERQPLKRLTFATTREIQGQPTP